MRLNQTEGLNGEQSRRYHAIYHVLGEKRLLEMTDDELEALFKKIDKIHDYVINGTGSQPAELQSQTCNTL